MRDVLTAGRLLPLRPVGSPGHDGRRRGYRAVIERARGSRHEGPTPSYLDHAADGVGTRHAYRRGNLIAGLVWGISSLILVKVIVWGTVEVARTADPQGLLAAATGSDHAPWPWLGFLAALVGFIPLAVVLPIVIGRIHRRPWRTAMTPYLTIDGRQILLGAAVFGALYVVAALVAFALLRESVAVEFDLGTFLPGVGVLLALAWVQAFGQELFFRGYCLQWAWLDTRSPRVLGTISGLAFGVPFLFAPFVVQWLVPEIRVPDASLSERAVLMLGYVLVGATLAVVSVRTGTIELAIGAAFSFNVLTALVLAPRAGQLSGGSVLEVRSGVLPTLVYVVLLAVALAAFARLSRRLAPDPAGRPLLRAASTAELLSLPAGNPMWRVSVRNLTAHRLRLALMLLTVTLSVTFVSATMVFADTTNRALDRFFATVPADVVVQPDDPVTVFGDAGRPPARSFDERVARTVAAVPGVRAVAPSVQQEGVLILAADGQPIGTATTAHIGASWHPDQIPREAVDLAGLPTGMGEVAVDDATAERHGISPGDTIHLATPLQPDRNRAWTVTGVVDLGLAGGATVAVFDLPTAQRLITGAGRVNQLLVTTDGDPAVVAAAINDRLAPETGVTAVTGRQAADQQAAAVQSAIAPLTTMLTVFAVIAVVAAVFLILNTFGMVVSQRTRELSLLRAVGARAEQVRAGVVVQAVLLGVVGTLLGVVAGLYLAVALRRILRGFDIEVPGGGLVVSSTMVAMAAVVGLGATVAAAWWPSLGASRTPPVVGMAAGHHHDRDAAIRRAVVVSLLAGLTAVTAFVAVRDSLAENAVAWMALSALLGVCTFVVVAPWLVRPFLWLLGLALRGPTARLALGNTRRMPHRVTATTAALTLGVALVSLMAVLTSSATASAEREIGRAFRAELQIGAPPLFRPYDHAITQRAGAVPGVAAMTYLRTTSGQRNEIPIPVFGVEPGRIGEALLLTVTAGSLDRIGGDRVALDTRLAARYRTGVGDGLTAVFRTGPAKLRVVALYEPVIVFEGVLSDLATAERLGAPPGQDTAAYFTLAAGADPAAVRAGIEQVAAANPALRVQDTASLTQGFVDSVRQLLALVFAMLAVAVVIALLAILITLLLQVSERTAEIGMLRAIGATRQQIRRMIAIEAAVLGGFGAVCGIALGAGFGVGMRAVMAPLGMTQLALPWGWFALLGVTGALAGVLAAVGPAISAARLNVLQAIAVD